jgi:hypothetical protein
VLTLVSPHDGPVTQWFGNIQPDGLPHAGQDYGYTGPDGTVYPNVYAAAPGVVVYAGDSRALGWPNPWYFNPDFDRTDARDDSAGNTVVIEHDGGHVTTYDHLESWTVERGDRVEARQIIGITGATGRATGKHLHWELITAPFNFGTATYGRVDPNPYLSGAIAPEGTIKKEDEFMGGLIDAGQANDIVEQTVERLLDRLPELLDNKVRINAVQAESIVRATTGRVVAILKGDKIDPGQADDIARASAEYVMEELEANK